MYPFLRLEPVPRMPASGSVRPVVAFNAEISAEEGLRSRRAGGIVGLQANERFCLQTGPETARE